MFRATLHRLSGSLATNLNEHDAKHYGRCPSLFKVMRNSPAHSSYTGGIPQPWHSGWDLHFCHTAIHTNVTAVTITIRTSMVVTVRVLWQRCTRLCCDSSGLDCTVTAIAATLVCQWCNWQRCNNDDNDNAVTLLCTLGWLRWQLTALWQRSPH